MRKLTHLIFSVRGGRDVWFEDAYDNVAEGLSVGQKRQEHKKQARER
jgi:hypothetical protein